MAHWVVGDVHGCWVTLQRLLERIGWHSGDDHLWFVGDLVNKGKHSLQVLRWAASAGSRVGCVLGNLDLHLMARAEGLAPWRPQDTIGDVLEAPDRNDLLLWLRRQPFVRRHGNTVVVHAGFMPTWTLARAVALADRCSEIIVNQGVGGLWSGRKALWRPGLDDEAGTAAAAGILTMVRMIGRDGLALLDYAGGPEDAPEGATPWFDRSAALVNERRVVFGHWACLGLVRTANVLCLDSGCVYGGALTAFEVDSGILVREPCDPDDRLS